MQTCWYRAEKKAVIASAHKQPAYQLFWRQINFDITFLRMRGPPWQSFESKRLNLMKTKFTW